MSAVVLPPRIDPSHRANYPIIIGDDLLREETPRKRQKISVQYNYQPQILNEEPTTLRTSTAGQEKDTTLTLSRRGIGEAGSFTYEGGQEPSTSLALIFDSEKTAFVLDKINTDCQFNLRTTPTEDDSAKVIARYPQIGSEQNSKDTPKGSGNGDDEDAEFDTLPPDPDNPFDYRHSLNRTSPPPPQASLNSPRPHHALHSSPLLKTTSPIQRPRSRAAPEKPVKSRKRRDPPRNRKTIIHKDEHDPNELVIDMGDSEPNPSKSWHRSMLGDMLNERGRSGDRKPMSMRSVASSMSPSVRAESDEERNDKPNDDVEEIDLGESRLRDVADADDGAAEGNGWDDEVFDILQQEMDQAMEGQDDSKQAESLPAVPLLDSSSESEEE